MSLLRKHRRVEVEPSCELPGFRGCAPRRRGSGQANKAERTGTACRAIRGATWLGSVGYSQRSFKRGFPLISSKSKIRADSYSEFPNNCGGWKVVSDKILQPRYDYFPWLPYKVKDCNTVPSVGD